MFYGPIVFTNVQRPRSEFPQRGGNFYTKTLVKKSASIGANATIVCGNTIGKYAFIGAGAVVTRDIPDFALVIGNPGRIVGWVNRQGIKLNFDVHGKSSCKNHRAKNCSYFNPSRLLPIYLNISFFFQITFEKFK